jgi:hypothetical protein
VIYASASFLCCRPPPDGDAPSRRLLLRCGVACTAAAFGVRGAAAQADVPAPEADDPEPAGRVSAVLQSGGVGLRLEAPAHWPAFESRAALWIDLQNLEPRPLRFWLLDSLAFSLSTASGTPLPLNQGRDALGRGDRITPVLAPGQSHRVVRQIGLSGAGGSRLQLADGFGGLWWSDPLPSEPLRLAVTLDHPSIDYTVPVDGVALWTGHQVGPSIPVLR